MHGRLFVEQVIRENLDIGRPEDVRLIFNRKITRRTPGSFRTRIVTHDITPSLNVYYKNTSILDRWVSKNDSWSRMSSNNPSPNYR